MRDLIHPRTALALAAIGLIVVGVVQAQLQPAMAVNGTVNSQMGFQGRLLTASGAVVPDGNYNLQFKIYRDGDGTLAGNTGGVGGALLWTESRLNQASNGVTVKNGYFSVQLGSVTPLPATLNESVLWLSMNIGGGGNATSPSCTPFSSCSPDGEMLPMKRLSSAAYALNAENANTFDGLNSTAFGQLSATQSWTAANTFNRSGGAAVVLSGSAASAGTQLQFGSVAALSSGSTNGTYLGANAAAYSGDFINFQINNAVKLKVDNTGNLTLGSGAAITIGASAGATTTCSGGQVLQDQVLVGGIVTGGTCAAPAATGANTSLSNLVATSINQSLVANANNTLNLGSAANVWANTYTGSLDAGTTTTTLAIGTINATSITIGNTSSSLSLESNATLNIGSGATAHTIAMGTGAAVQGITIGSTNGASSLTLQAGTGGMTLTTQGGTLGVGTNAVAQTINIGNATGATAVAVSCGTGACSFGANAIAHTTTLGSATGAAATTVQCGTGACSLGSNATAHATTVGSATGAAATTIQAGTGNLSLTTQGTGTLGVGNNAVAQTINVGNGTGATAVSVLCGTGACGFGNNGVAHATTVGSATGAAATTIQAGTGNLSLTTQGTGTLGVGNNAVAQTVAIGNTTGATAVTLQGGSGGVSINASTNSATNIGTGSSTGLVTIGGGNGTFALNTTNIDISAAGVVSGATGVTSSGTITFSGLTNDGPVYTTSGVLNSEANLSVTRGGTGFGATTPYGLIAGGTTATGTLQNTGTGTAGQILVSNGTSSLPVWTDTSTVSVGSCGGCIVQGPTSTLQNSITPSVNSVVALTLKGTTGTPANVLEIFNSSATPTRQAFFDATGSLNVSQLIQPTANNTLDVGLSATAFRTGYFGTSVVTPLVDTAATLSVGTSTATAVSIGRSGQTTTINGPMQGVMAVLTGANALTLGTASANTGAVVFRGAGGAGTLTLTGPTAPNAGNYTLSIPAIAANANICTDNAVCSGYQGTANAVITNPTATQTIDSGANNITGLVIQGSSHASLPDIFTVQTSTPTVAFKVNSAGRTFTGGNLYVGTTSVPSGVNNGRLTVLTPDINTIGSVIRTSGVIGTGSPVATNLDSIQLQDTNGVCFWRVSNMSISGSHSSGSCDSSTTATIQTTLRSGDVTGAFTSGVAVVRSGNSTAGNTGAVNITTGNATTGISGAITIDPGTGGSGTSSVTIGGVNANAVAIGHGGITTTVTGNLSQVFSGTSGTATNHAVTNGAASGTNAVAGVGVNLVGTNTSGTNTNTGLSFGNVAAATNNTFYGISFGTGFNDLLRYNGAQLISGTGLMQNAAVDSSLTYSNLQRVGVLSVGSIASGFGTISTGNNITTTTAVQGGTGIFTGANALTLGTASSNTGAVVFRGSGGSGTLTLQGPISPSASNFTLSLPAIGANATVCTDNTICTGYAPASGSASYIQNQIAAQQSSSNFWISASGRADTSFLTPALDVATAGALGIGANNANAINVGNSASNILTTIRGTAVVRPAGTDSVTAFRVLDQPGTTTVLDVDTANDRVGIGTATPGFTLDVAGIANASTSVLTPLLDTASGVALNIGTTNATVINLNENISVAAGKNISFAAGAGNFDQSASTGTFASGIGAVSLNGDTTVAAGKNLSLASGTGRLSQTYTGTTTDATTITANSLTTGAALKVISANNTAANSAWSGISLNTTNNQGTTPVSTGTIAGLNLQFTQTPTVAGSTETVANFEVAATGASPGDTAVASILNVGNNDTATGNQITVTDGIHINGANVTNGINLAGTFGTNLITASNFTLTQAGGITTAGNLTVQGTGNNALSGSLVFNGVGTDVTTNTNEHLTLLANGTGQIILNDTTQLATLGTANTSTWLCHNASTQFAGCSTTAYGLVTGGTTATGAFQNAGTGTANQILRSNGAVALPTWVNNTGANVCADCLIQAPSSTATNTVTPTGSTTGLVVNGSSTATTAAIFNQGQAADGVNINVSNASSTATNGLVVNKTGGGNLTNALNIINATGTTSTAIAVTNTSGTMTMGLGFTGTIGTDISRATGTLTVQGGGGVTVSTANVSGASGAILIQGGNSSAGTAGNVTLDTGTTSTGTPTVNIGTANARAVVLGSTSTGTITVGQATTNNTINIGNATTAAGNTQTINIGTSATSTGNAAITIGNTNGASSLNLQAGTGNTNVLANNSQVSSPMLLLQQAGTGDSSLEFRSISAGTSFYAGQDTSNSGAFVINSSTAAAPSAITHIQSTSQSPGPSAGNVAATFASSPGSGHLIVAAATWGLGTGTITCTDSQGNAYTTQLVRNDTGNSQSFAICWAITGASTANTVTATFSGGAATFRQIVISEYSGVATSSPVDASVISAVSSSSTGTDAVTSGTATTTQPGDLIYGAVDDTDGATTITAGTGFTSRVVTSGNDVAAEDKVQSSAGSVQAPWTFTTGGHDYIAGMIAFKAAPVSLTDTFNNPLFSISQTGSTVLRNSSDSATAFQVQNASGNQVFSVDTSANQVTLGKASALAGKLQFRNATNANAVTLQSGTTSSSYSITLPTVLGGAVNDCLKDTTGTGVLAFAACGNASGTLQGSYNAHSTNIVPEIKVDSTRQAVDIQDANTTLGSGIFNVRGANAAGLGSVLFGVSNTGITVGGSTLLTTLAVTDKASGGNIGTAAATVDIYTSFNVNQTTAGQTLTLPNPTVTTAGRIVYVNNIGTDTFNFYDTQIVPGGSRSMIWTGSAWALTGDSDERTTVTRRKVADEIVTSNTTLQPDDHFIFPVRAGETWYFQGQGVIEQAGGDGGFKAAFTAPAGSTCTISVLGSYHGSSDDASACGTSADLTNAELNDNGTEQSDGISFFGSVVVGGTSGTVNFQWAQTTSDSVGTRLARDSYMTGYRLAGADVAEVYFARDGSITAGDVVAIDGSGISQVRKTNGAYDSKAIGIISTKPGMVIGEHDGSGKPVIVGLAGRVPVKVSGENGAIEPGDFLVASSTPGVAMKAIEPGMAIGQALTSFSGEGRGTVLVFIKNTYYAGDTVVGGVGAAPLSQLAINPTSLSADTLTVTGVATIGTLLVSGSATIAELRVTKIATFESNIVVEGHIVTGGANPQVAAALAAGEGADVAVDGNDTSGTITITTGVPQRSDNLAPRPQDLSIGELVNVKFAKAYGKKPKLFIQPNDDFTQQGIRFAKEVTAEGYKLMAIQPAAQKTTYKFDYFVIE